MSVGLRAAGKICIYIMHVYIYIYIYMERERETYIIVIVIVILVIASSGEPAQGVTDSVFVRHLPLA